MAKSIFDIFGVRVRTRRQKRFVKYFVLIKTITYVVIFVLVVIFLWRLKNLGR